MKKPQPLNFSFGIELWPNPCEEKTEVVPESIFNWSNVVLSIFFLFGLVWVSLGALMGIANDSFEGGGEP